MLNANIVFMISAVVRIAGATGQQMRRLGTSDHYRWRMSISVKLGGGEGDRGLGDSDRGRGGAGIGARSKPR